MKYLLLILFPSCASINYSEDNKYVKQVEQNNEYVYYQVHDSDEAFAIVTFYSEEQMPDTLILK